MANVTQWFTWR